MRALSLTFILGLMAACGEKEPVDSATDADGDGFTADEDCDDNDAAVNPDATEVCDGIDNNCDGAADEGLLITVYGDQDGDGFGVDAQSSQACAAEAGQSELGGDCNDGSADVYPGAPEEDCTDPIDYNCDGVVEYEDGDGDGYAACVDCDDADGEIHPDADEVCDGVDNNCDGEVDEATAVDALTFYADLDMDGYGDVDNPTVACTAPSGFVDDATDCDDSADSIYPGAVELCDAVDSDCDGVIGEVRVPSDYATIQAAIDAGEPEVCVEAGTYTEALEFSVDLDLTLEGVGSDQVTLDGGDSERVMSVAGGPGTLTLRGLTVANGFAEDDYAGGLYYEGDGTGTLLIEDVVFSGNVNASGLGYGAAASVLSYDQATFTDVEVSDNTLYGVPFGQLYLYLGESLALDGVSVHDNVVDSVESSTGHASVIFAQNNSTDSTTGYYDSVVSFNDVDVSDNTINASGTVYAPVTLRAIGTVDVRNSRFTGNSSTVGGFCVTPSLFPFSVQTGTYNNLELIGNDCTAVSDVYTTGFWQYGTSLSQGSSGAMENVIIAGNTGTSGNVVWGAWVFDYYGTMTYTNVSVHGNVATGARGYSGWLLYGDNDVTLNNVDVSGNSFTTSSTASYATGFGMVNDGDSLSIAYSNLIDLGDTPFSSNLTDPTGTDGVISEDPGYADVSDADPLNWDLTLGSGSDLLDAGDPSLSDPDGSTSDIGAYGGPGAADW
ncbi:MAG: hypothetical protein H6740_23330 [Alphaproteobacteria bacterium]|nr:hypothetical protein [Alphaproteobacteria bacterium]